MESKEIIEGNKMIAEFMGLILHKPDKTFNIEQWWSGDSSDGRKKGEFVGYSHQLEYNTSWDWLMPVVEKIEKLGLGYFKYHYTWSYYNFKGNCLWYKNNNEKGIMNLFFEVIEFIKWYNENKNN
jgi:hypothetical protein